MNCDASCSILVAQVHGLQSYIATRLATQMLEFPKIGGPKQYLM